MSISQTEMFKKCDELGESKIRENLNSNIWNSSKQKHATEWLRQLEAKRNDGALSRQEGREDESLSISKRALLISEDANTLAEDANSIASKARSDALKARSVARCANIIAIIAIVLSTIITIAMIVIK